MAADCKCARIGVSVARGRVPYFYVALCIVSTVPCRLYKGRGTISYLLNPVNEVGEDSSRIGLGDIVLVPPIRRKVVPRAVGGDANGKWKMRLPRAEILRFAQNDIKRKG